MECIGGVTLPLLKEKRERESFIRLFSFEKTSPETEILEEEEEEEIAILSLFLKILFVW